MNILLEISSWIFGHGTQDRLTGQNDKEERYQPVSEITGIEVDYQGEYRTEVSPRLIAQCVNPRLKIVGPADKSQFQ